MFVDWNKQQLDGELDEIICAFDLEGKFRAFGFDVVTVKGDDIPALLAVTSRVPTADARPLVVILDSIKGQGGAVPGTAQQLAPPAIDRGEQSGPQ